MPHVWRQSDTLGVSLRYWLRFTEEPWSWQTLLPAVLQSGEGNGIMGMEFPILNLLFSPSWALGPYWGKIICSLGIIFLTYGLSLHLSRSRTWLSRAFLLFPVLSYSADYIDKFMPDTLAALLVCWGMLRLLKRRPLSGTTLLTLGLLIKPPVVVALAILPLFSNFRKTFLRFVAPIACALLLTFLYYTAGIRFIDSLRMGTAALYATEFRDPIRSFVDVFSDPSLLWSQLRDRMWMSFGVFLLGITWLVARVPKKRVWITLFSVLLILQFATIGALDGLHLAIHDYYLMGLAPVACAFLYLGLRSSPTRWATIASIVVIGHAIELASQRLSIASLHRFYDATQECSLLKLKTPSAPWKAGRVYRAPPSPYPTLGLCFGVREGGKGAPFGVFRAGEELPNPCRPLESGAFFKVADCRARNPW